MRINLDKLTIPTKFSLLLSIPFLFLIFWYLLSYLLESISDSYSGENTLLWFALFITPAVALSSPFAFLLGVIGVMRSYRNRNSNQLFSVFIMLLGFVALAFTIWSGLWIPTLRILTFW